jgi:hypothetical protein
MTEGRVSSQRYVPQEGSKWIIYGIDLLDESIIQQPGVCPGGQGCFESCVFPSRSNSIPNSGFLRDPET